MAECATLFEQRLDLARAWRRPPDLFEGPFHFGAPHRRRAQPSLKRVAFVLRVADRVERGRHLSPQVRVPPHFVHGLARRTGLEQGQVLPLAVDLGEDPTQRAQHPHRNRCSVHGDPIGHRAPSGRHAQLPPDDEILVFGRYSRLVAERPESLPARRSILRRGEPRLDDGAVGRRAHELRTAAATENQSQSLEQDALADSGLTGDDVQPLSEFKRNVLQEGDVLRPEPVEHRGRQRNRRRRFPG